MLLPANLRTLLAVSVLSTPAIANTWIVSNFGGPGVDFTNIQPAIDAAAPGDLILIHPGHYLNGFVLDKALTLLGTGPGVNVNNLGVVSGIPLDETAALARMNLRGLRLVENDGTVVLETVAWTESSAAQPFLDIDRTHDVRMMRCSFPGQNTKGVRALIVNDSNLDMVEGNFHSGAGHDGQAGEWTPCMDGGPGAVGVEIFGGRAHFSLTDLHGGGGGWVYGSCDVFCWNTWPGNGGTGLIARDGAFVHLAGNWGQSLRGGLGGASLDCGFGGNGGGLVLVGQGTHGRHSGIEILGGPNYGSSHPAVQTGGGATAAEPDPVDPTLTLANVVPAQDGNMRFVVYGEPGDQVTLLLARSPARIPIPGVVVDQLTTEDYRPIFMGMVFGADANVTHLRPLPPGTPAGATILAQARVMRAGQELRTNSVAFVVRTP